VCNLTSANGRKDSDILHLYLPRHLPIHSHDAALVRTSSTGSFLRWGFSFCCHSRCALALSSRTLRCTTARHVDELDDFRIQQHKRNLGSRRFTKTNTPTRIRATCQSRKCRRRDRRRISGKEHNPGQRRPRSQCKTGMQANACPNCHDASLPS
jgi:hypothetical protein